MRKKLLQRSFQPLVLSYLDTVQHTHQGSTFMLHVLWQRQQKNVKGSILQVAKHRPLALPFSFSTCCTHLEPTVFYHVFFPPKTWAITTKTTYSIPCKKHMYIMSVIFWNCLHCTFKMTNSVKKKTSAATSAHVLSPPSAMVGRHGIFPGSREWLGCSPLQLCPLGSNQHFSKTNRMNIADICRQILAVGMLTPTYPNFRCWCTNKARHKTYLW